jgi:hypothetical protein
MKNYSRRSFIKDGINTSLLFSIGSPLAFLLNKKSVVLPSWIELVEIARWCPTVHNLQPHRIKVISKTEAELYYNPKKLLPIGDPKSIFSTIAMGIFVEHLSIAAATHGCSVKIKNIKAPISTKNTALTPFATLELHPNKEAQNEILTTDLFTKRRTSREIYNGQLIKNRILNQVKAQAEEFNHEFFYTQKQELIDEIVKLNQKTLFEDLEANDNRKELDALFRYSKAEAAKQRDGLWAKCMGFSGKLMKSVFQKHHKWTKGARQKLLSSHYKKSFNGTTTMCWFNGRFENTEDWLQAGRMLARNWLLITKENAYIQPFGSLITNTGAYERINEIFAHPSDDKKIWMVFRVGYSDTPTRSFRLDTQDLIINSNTGNTEQLLSSEF